MNLRISAILACLCSSLLFSGCKTSQTAAGVSKQESQSENPSDTPEISPAPQVEVGQVNKEKKDEDPRDYMVHPPLDIYEFRAAWVATVANINWPSKAGLSTYEQQKEALKLLDFLENNNFNAVIFQVRPQADALYESEIEPWSYFLTGKQGKAPDPYYDPLKFWIQAAHERGLELHVWLNPYRAHHTTGGDIGEQSIIKKNPELAVKLENGMWWLDPSRKETQQHSLSVVKDLVNRYDLDGIHFDDYFYPYDSYNNGKDFPDDLTWKAYQAAGGNLSRSDWRRESVNNFIQQVYKTIKAEKPYVKFGLSPFGIWRPGYPQSVSGYDQYEKLYADAKLWLNEGWIDYFTPQLYWKINQEGQSFPELLGWWETENHKDRHLWPGIRVDYGGDEKNVDETINQIMISRGMLPESPGVVHWSIGPLMKYESLNSALKNGPYKKKSLVPASPWLNKTIPATPMVRTKVEDQRLLINWEHPKAEDIFRWVVYFKYQDGNWDYKILNKGTNNFSLQYVVGEKNKKLEKLAVSAVDRTGNQSDFEEISPRNANL